ncbi:MAG: hypothetical protein H0V44_02140 [Planctomycetes bacterium]|nr:hypothetical protein [Planctomycetota bacterium]
MSALLVAGAVLIEDVGDARALIGGAGAYAAIAGAPLATTQLWAQAGSGFPPQARTIFENHRIDLAGVSWDGTSASAAVSLPEIEPTSAEDLGAAAVVRLGPAEAERAFAVIARLGQRPTVVVAPHRACDRGHLQACAQAADILVLPLAVAAALAGGVDALAAGMWVRDLGAKAVVLTAGILGGLIIYGDKAVTYASMPMPKGSSRGTGAAFSGALAGWCAGEGADFRAIKRGCAMASAVAGICDQGVGPKKLLAAGRKEYIERFNRLRRTNKF